jgi:hypothetical protein
MQCVVTYATGMYLWLSEISSEIYNFNFRYPYQSDVPYLLERRREDPW